MAARRLIIVMLVLLGISSAIAVLVPAPKEEPAQEENVAATGSTGATGVTDVTGATGDTGVEPKDQAPSDTVEAEVVADEGTQIIAAKPGQRLVFSVETAVPADVQIPALGLTETATEYEPARFDIIMPAEPQTFEVEQFGNNGLLATISSAPHNLESQAREEERTRNNPRRSSEQ